MRLCLVVLAACLPPDQAPVAPVAPDPDLAAIVHTWQIAGHVLGTSPTLGESDATAFDGRTIEVSATGYTSPWQGTCSDAARSKRQRPLADITTESELTGSARARLASSGFASPVTEYRITCSDRRALPLVLVVKGDHAFTCWGGICYLLTGRR
jgi:hypothetical protein